MADAEDGNTRNTASIGMDAARARQILNRIVEETHRIRWTEHARERMTERGISSTQVLRAIRHGQITEGPAPDLRGGWRLSLDVLAAGDPIRVVTVITRDERGDLVVVITTHELE